MAKFAMDTGVVMRFLGFAQLQKGTSAHIMEVLQQFLDAKGVEFDQMRFIALDGRNTMSGVQTGLQRRVRHQNPFVVYVNCRNHRLALCMAHLIKRFPLLQDVDGVLISLWKMFEFSPQKMAVFKHIQAVYGKTPMAITRAAATRWLSHLQASSRFISRYTCILDTLDSLYEERREPDIMGVRQSVTIKSVVATILLLTDILKPVNLLSLYLQEEHIRFTMLPSYVKNTTDHLHSLKDTYQQHIEGNNLSEMDAEFSKISDLFSEIDDRTTLAMRRRGNRGQNLTGEDFLREKGIPLVYDLINEIEDAFNTGMPVLGYFGFFDPQNLPESMTDIEEYGKGFHCMSVLQCYCSQCYCSV
ncbi:uncharacterized protein LOC117335439 [Pecten maximus]|uniref:uncharacterized protein LOC117335439 n=1 Tax=Pecten maximus TaxID=6579 RepID=UPI001458DB82|nr:uncharacterized protein LOC117335439 [Pecten maximus]